MLAVLMAESDGYSVEIPARLTITEAPAKLQRMAVLLGQPGSGLARAADFARVESKRVFGGDTNGTEDAALRLGASNVTGKLGRSAGKEYRRLVRVAMVRDLGNVPQADTSMLTNAERQRAQELAANPGQPGGELWAGTRARIGPSLASKILADIAAFNEAQEESAKIKAAQKIEDNPPPAPVGQFTTGTKEMLAGLRS